MPPLSTGQPVLVKRGKEEQRSGIVQGGASKHRTYTIKTSKGIIRRNRRHLQSIPSYRETHNTDCDDINNSNSKSGSKNHDTEQQPPTDYPDNVPVRRSSRVIKKPRHFIEE